MIYKLILSILYTLVSYNGPTLPSFLYFTTVHQLLPVLRHQQKYDKCLPLGRETLVQDILLRTFLAN